MTGRGAFVVCRTSQPDPYWDGAYATAVSPADAHRSLFVVIEMRGSTDIRFGDPNDEAIKGHPLHGNDSAPTSAPRRNGCGRR